MEYEGDDADAARTAAMQIAAMRPQYLSRDEVPADLRRERAPDRRGDGQGGGQARAQAVPRIVEGRVNAFFKDVALLDQPSVTDNKTPVSKLLDEAGVKVTRFVRFEAAAEVSSSPGQRPTLREATS